MILKPNEIWRRVSPQVEVSTFGNNKKNGKIVDRAINRGYYANQLHRQIAETFIPNPLNKPEVHHIDGNKLNNHISNLQWVTNLENEIDPIRRQRLSKQVRVWNDEGFDQVFPSIIEAQRILGVGNLARVARGVRPQAKGYHAEYIEGEDDERHMVD